MLSQAFIRSTARGFRSKANPNELKTFDSCTLPVQSRQCGFSEVGTLEFFGSLCREPKNLNLTSDFGALDWKP